MNRWQRGRKRLILLIFVLALLVLVLLPLYYFFYRAPTCSDGKINGDETGLDCGGSCQRLCAPDSLPLISRGDTRVLKIATSTYEAVAIVENPNAGEVRNAEYTIQVYSGGVSPTKIIKGEIYVPPNSRFAIFEGPFILDSTPTRAILEWHEDTLSWQKSKANSPIEVKSSSFTRILPTRLQVRIVNTSLNSISNIDLIALISDKEGNLFAASKTLVDKISSKGEAVALFSWQQPFPTEPASIEILIKLLPSRILR